MTIREAITTVVQRRDLTEAEMEAVVEELIGGRATDAQIGALLAGLTVKGESVEELCGAARALRAHASVVAPPAGMVVDTCGTGGDARGTFNISTAAALIVAASGTRVAKHGNRAISGTVGGADVLEALGVNLSMSPDDLGRCIAEVGIAFLFAPSLHPAMAKVAGPRRELGIRTIFNLVGPLANPAAVRYQLVGVSRRDLVVPMATALARLGSERALVVRGRDGLDEITLTDVTDMAEARDGRVSESTLSPEDVGMARSSIDALRIRDTEDAAAAVREVLGGREGPRRDVALVNAAAALYVAGRCDSVGAGVKLAADAVDSGRSQAVLGRLVAWSRGHTA